MNAHTNVLIQLVNDFIRFLSIGIGFILVIMMAWAGFRYLTAGSNANQVAEAKGQITNVIFALILYILGFALLNWLSPGGVNPLGL